MKRLLVTVLIVSLISGVVLSCGGGNGGDGGSSDPTTGFLTIRNQSSGDLELVHWVDGIGNTYFFGVDLIWDPYLGDYVYGMMPGSSYFWEVLPGISYIYFWLPNSPDMYRTDVMVSVGAGEDVVFTFTDSTMVVAMGEQEGLVFDLENAVSEPSSEEDRRDAAIKAERQLE
jgi:hypothetical protein